MSLLRELLSEDAAAGCVSATSIAVVPGGGPVGKRGKKGKKNPMFAGGLLKRVTLEGKKSNGRRLNEADDDSDFDENDAEAKLKHKERQEQNKSTAKAFAMEDEDGNTVRIFVKRDDANDFESALEDMLSTGKSIAEIVFELNGDFDIIDVEWGDIEEDEEETPDQASQQPGAAAGDKTPPNPMDDIEQPEGGAPEAPGDLSAPAPESDDLNSNDDVKSALQQVIDMLRKDIEAKKAEAEAKKAEAEAKKAEAFKSAQREKMKTDAELLDAQEFFKKQKEQDKQERDMAMLAKYRYERDKEGSGIDEFGLPKLESAAEKLADRMFESFINQTSRRGK